jgi:hypothetical protein
MKQPNDKKRPNSNTAKETRERERNYKYIWVSKRLFEVPVFNDDGSLTNIKQIVVEKKGHTYVRPEPKQLSKRDFGRKYGWQIWWDLRPIGVGE